MSVVLLAHVIVQSIRFTTGDDSLGGLVFLFSVGADANFPTYYSSFAILCCAGALALLGKGEQHGALIRPAHWFGLSLIFVFLSIDEMLELHERATEPMRSIFGTSGLFYYAWVIPYSLAALLIFGAYVRFLFALPKRTSILIIVAGFLFVGGAVGVEMLGGLQAEVYGTRNLTYVLLQTLEETMEMSGIILFLFALADYAERRYGALELHLRPSNVHTEANRDSVAPRVPLRAR